MTETDTKLDLLWGVDAIATEINQSRRKTYHLLETGRLPARKVGARWCASRSGLREFFRPIMTGELAQRVEA